jgi:hypothetical protein
VVVVLTGAVDTAGLDDDDPDCEVAEADPMADPSPPIAAVMVSTVAGTRLVAGGAAAIAPEAVPGSRVDAPEVTVLINPWGSSDSAGVANPPTGAADSEAPERTPFVEEARL